MFTGIVTHIGRVAAIEDGNAGRTLEIETDMPLEALPLGASVCHSGICLTVTAKTADRLTVFASSETLARSTLGGWHQGRRINLEASLRLGDELGGHLVFGHVDAVGEIRAIEPDGESHKLVVGMPSEMAPLVAVKGSIAVDGISLTVNVADEDSFAVMIIPHTWQATTLADRRPGDRVNLEVDMLARYVARQLAFREPGRGDG